MSEPSAFSTAFRWRTIVLIAGIFVLAVAAVAVVRILQKANTRATEERIRTAVLTRIQRESPAAFLVTGTLDIVSETSARSTYVFLPDVLNLDLGTTDATVRVPGRVSYGFDVRDIKADMIRVGGDSLIEIVLPQIRTFAVEPNLAQMEVRTSRGWLRSAASEKQVTQRAVALLQAAMRKQADDHIRSSIQPRTNTAVALEAMLRPQLEALDHPHMRIRVQLGNGVLRESTGSVR